MPELVLTTIVTSAISATIAAFVSSIVTQLKSAGKQSAEEAERARQEAEDIRDTLNQNTLMTCRLVIYSDKFDIDEKIEAYIVYRNKGGNHRTKEYMDEQVGCDIDDYIARHKR